MKVDQQYDPVEIESQWYDFWVDGGFFKADEHSDKEPYTIVIPPPNVTGSLHMGHALFVTLQDILIRWKRMQGYETLWLPGTDHAGIATQVVVERLLRKEGISRHDLGREKFLERVWEWKEKSGGRIIEQLKKLGASCDWERERFTMDEGLSHAVRTIFVRMYEDDLIYRGDRMVNWDPETKTVLSNLEVLTKKEGEAGKFWYLKYPLADGSGHIIVGTTRPETMLGDTAVAVHPDDDRYKDLIGKMIALPLTDRQIPIIADKILPDPEKGTGAVKVTPAHDPNDFDCGQRHDLDLIQVIGLDATMIPETCPEDFAGLDRYAARKLVIEKFDELGLLDKIDNITFHPGRSERSGVIVEPLVMKQWFVRGEPLAKPARDAVEQGKTRIIPEVWKKTYDHFMYNIQEWCISRQLWWGHQIPAWYGPDGEVFVAMTEEEAQEKANAHYGEAVEIEQDQDVLDTWFSSGLWPFSTMGWPEKTATLEKFYPTQVLETGSDILFFWVARMMMMGIYAMGEVPFEDVFLHAMVRDAKGDKMSKVKGNVIDPLHMIFGASLPGASAGTPGVEELDADMHKELIAKIEAEDLSYSRGDVELPGITSQGADALRLTLAIMAAQARDIKLDISRMEGYRAFLNKLWNASRFAMMNMEGFEPSDYSTYMATWDEKDQAPFDFECLGLADRWILGRVNATSREVTAALDEYKFNDAAQALYHFVWHELCDWYIELIKPRLYDESEENAPYRRATLATLDYVRDVSLRLLHPISPFITEDIWQSFARTGEAPEALVVAPWPEPQPLLGEFEREKGAMELAFEIISSVRTVRGETNIKPSVRIPTAYLISDDEGLRASVEATRDYIGHQAKIDAIELLTAAEADALEGAAATAVAGGVEIRFMLKGLIDVEEELTRLRKEISRVEDDMAFVNKKLGNPKFVERAPDHIVQKERDKLAGFEQEKSALESSMSELENLR
jgi:valyl-tRNA synthetase